MKYCSTCGKELADNAVSCPNCGFVFPRSGTVSGINDAPSFGYALLGFFIPLIGIILYVIWKPTTPLRAKSAGKGALTAIILGIILGIISGVITALGAGYYGY
ncbi:MAG TPA: zinc ribbon domain-containing protein [Acholeplasmatales bacterium]|nr:zinc ribbon domain-containing protein [Acholeplasmatales bacterium]